MHVYNFGVEEGLWGQGGGGLGGGEGGELGEGGKGGRVDAAIRVVYYDYLLEGGNQFGLESATVEVGNEVGEERDVGAGVLEG